jgi:alpha-D-xyloside xylohydrolase
MRFTNGFWLLREGVRACYGKTAHRIDRTESGLTIFSPSKVIADRGDTLNIPLITTRLHSPMKNIIGMKVTHHEGGIDRGPHFELTGDGSSLQVAQSAATYVATSGDLTATITQGESFHLALNANGKELTRVADKGIAWMDHNGDPFVNIQLNLAVGELV